MTVLGLTIGPSPSSSSAATTTAGAVDSREAVNDLFRMIDTDGQGTIDIKELAKAVRPSAAKIYRSTGAIGPCVIQPMAHVFRKNAVPRTKTLVPPPRL